MTDEIKYRILNGEATENEKADFYSHIEENEVERNEFLSEKSLWVRASAKNSVDTDVEAEFDKFWSKISENRWRGVFNKLNRYAALILLFVSIPLVINYFKSSNTKSEVTFNTLKSGKQSISELILSDNSKVILNSDSEISYPGEFVNDERIIKLEGEAIFNVAKRKNPFIVDLGVMKIKVYGTVFNVRKTRDEVVTTLVEGSVGILTPNGKEIGKLKPGYNGIYKIKKSVLNIVKADTDYYTSWKDGKFVFMDKSLGEICNELSRWYDVRFEFKNPGMKNNRYNGIIKRTTTVKHIMRMLVLTADINYKIIESQDDKDVVVVY